MRNRTLIWLLLGGGAFVLFLVTAAALVVTLAESDGGGQFAFGDRIQLVHIDGTLTDSRFLLDQLKRYEDSDSVPAILLNIDSPGGDVATSQELYNEIRRLREEKGKVVVAYLSSVGASGAYYIACAADRILASPGTIVGSIGVIAQWLNYGELLDWAKLSSVVLKTGEFKDTGSPTRELTPREHEYFQGLIDDMYDQFVEAVATGRNLSVAEVRQWADGRVFTGREARELSMIDETGNMQDAIDLTVRLAGISGKPRLIEVQQQRVTLLDILTGDISRVLPLPGASMESQIRFQYLWK
jgi:protease-4